MAELKTKRTTASVEKFLNNIKKLEDVDLVTLKQLIKQSLSDMRATKR